jgi:hypothetical protein
MKKIVIYIFSFIIIFTVLNYSIAASLSKLYNTNYEGQSGGKINDLVKNHKKVQILAIGDSRCAHHVVPDVLGPNNFNLSHNGMSLIFHTGLIDQIINNTDISVDTILLNLDIQELIYSHDKKDFDIKQLKYFYGKNQWITNKINALNFKEKYKFLISIYKWNGKTPTLIANKGFKKNHAKNGYSPTLPTKRDSMNVFWQWRKTNNNFLKNKFFSINNKCLEYLSHVNSLCLKNDITLICFISPTYDQFEILPRQINKIVDPLTKKNIIVLDYSNEFHNNKKLQEIWNWNDVFHLNEKGANILSKKIRYDLNKI